MRILTAHIIERIVTVTVIAIILGMAGILFYFLSLRLGDIARENQAYNRYNACVLSIPAADRDEPTIDRCYKAAQRDTGIEIKRYDNQEQ